MEDLFKLLGLGTPFVYGGAAYGFFRWLDANISEEARTALTNTVQLSDYDEAKVSAEIISVFDRIYPSPLLSLRTFIRSLLFTMIVSTLYLYETFPREFWTAGDSHLVSLVLPVLLIGVSTNIFSDYCALFFIRRWLVTRFRSPVLSLFIGFATGACVVMFLGLLRRAITFVLVPFPDFSFLDSLVPERSKLQIIYSEVYDAFYFIFGPLGLTVPGMVVFAWLPLFAFGIMILRARGPASSAIGKMRWFLKDGKEHPLEAVGYVAGASVFALALACKVLFSKASA